MILRPESEAELLGLIAEIAVDPALELDTAAMLMFLFARTDLEFCPPKAAMPKMMGRATSGAHVGVVRLGRMFREAQRAGYLAKATGYIPWRGRQPVYTFIVGGKAQIADIIRLGGAL